MKALSVRQPWAHAILHLGKDVENRSWATNYRGSLLIHASRTPDQAGLRALRLDRDELTVGAIVGVVEVTDCVQGHASTWAHAGAWHWILTTPQPLEPIPCAGALRLFDPPNPVRQHVKRALRR